MRFSGSSPLIPSFCPPSLLACSTNYARGPLSPPPPCLLHERAAGGHEVVVRRAVRHHAVGAAALQRVGGGAKRGLHLLHGLLKVGGSDLREGKGEGGGG